ncbi:MAG: hypothetical protein WC179_05105 [Candidatus Cloacimonadaceae bacterium]
MKLELKDEEVSNYFEMHDEIKSLQNKVIELKAQIKELEITPNKVQECLTGEVKSNCNLQGKHWSDEDVRLLKDIIFYQGKYTRKELNVKYVHEMLFPFRTLAGVKSKIYELGGYIKQDQIKTKIHRKGN